MTTNDLSNHSQCKSGKSEGLHAQKRRPHRATGKPRGRPVSKLQLKKDAAATAFAMLGVSPTRAALYADQFFRTHAIVETDLSLGSITPKFMSKVSKAVEKRAAELSLAVGGRVTATFEIHTVDMASPEKFLGDWDASGEISARWANAAQTTRRRLASSQSKRKLRRNAVPGEHDEFVNASAYLLRDIIAAKTDLLAWRAYAALLVIGWPEQQVQRFIQWRFAMKNMVDLRRGILPPCNHKIAATCSALSQLVKAEFFESVSTSHARIA